MAFVKKTWKNRVSEFFNRYRVENVQTGAVSKVYMNLDDGAVTEEGDVIDADTMNDLEDRIEEALSDVGKGSNWVGTTEQWNAKTDEEKAEYDTYDLTDDFDGVPISYINNKHKITRKAVATSGWEEDTTSQSGTTLYKKSITLNNVYVESPSVSIGAIDVLPTSAEQEAYDLLQYVTVDSAIPCLYLYASDIPTDAFYINVEGVD